MSLSDLLFERFGESPAVPPELEFNPVLGAIADHRSCRNFSDAIIDPELLDTLVACALSAPSKSDLQQVALINIQDRELRSRIGALLPSMPWIETAPAFLLICGDNRRIRQICDVRERPFGNDHLDSFFNAAVDAGLVLMNLISAVQAAGLGCCPVSAVRNHAKAISDWVELPQYVFPVAGLAIGHPTAQAQMSPRLGPAFAWHQNRYRDTHVLGDLGGHNVSSEDGDTQHSGASEHQDTQLSGEDGDTQLSGKGNKDGDTQFSIRLDAADRRRHSQQPIAPEKQRLKRQYGVADFYGWSEDKARQVSVTERADFGNYVRKQGFKLD